MMEKLGQAKTHLELKKMIAEVDKNNSGEAVCGWGSFSGSLSVQTSYCEVSC